MSQKQLRNRKDWIKKLDKLLKEVVFARDKYCVRCGKTDKLAPSHIYPKGRYTRLRHDSDNVLTLCYGCHICWWHRNPIEAAEWFKEKYPDRYKKLKLRSQISWKGMSDYASWELLLKQELKKIYLARHKESMTDNELYRKIAAKAEKFY